ncbi:uncharacterized protein LOC125745107 [Brienomyrus brachyistius]|uniref:uncharacterized protein LOC125745107 n=1 Tax=Brienomyrus brachyistius TaxID=42636 RepID=UPI0020B2F206|nr:uncharacterized protein LOC125745107 [Brienomyrus brachyistius]
MTSLHREALLYWLHQLEVQEDLVALRLASLSSTLLSEAPPPGNAYPDQEVHKYLQWLKDRITERWSHLDSLLREEVIDPTSPLTAARRRWRKKRREHRPEEEPTMFLGACSLSAALIPAVYPEEPYPVQKPPVLEIPDQVPQMPATTSLAGTYFTLQGGSDGMQGPRGCPAGHAAPASLRSILSSVIVARAGGDCHFLGEAVTVEDRVDPLDRPPAGPESAVPAAPLVPAMAPPPATALLPSPPELPTAAAAPLTLEVPATPEALPAAQSEALPPASPQAPAAPLAAPPTPEALAVPLAVTTPEAPLQ